MPYIDGLPSATEVDVGDLVILGQGGVTGAPGTAITRVITVGNFMALSYSFWVATFPTSDPGIPDAIWNNGGVLSVSQGVSSVGIYGTGVYGGVIYG